MKNNVILDILRIFLVVLLCIAIGGGVVLLVSVALKYVLILFGVTKFSFGQIIIFVLCFSVLLSFISGFFKGDNSDSKN